MESTGIFPTENDITSINKKAQQLRDYDEVIVRNLQFFLPLQMDILVELRNKRRATVDFASVNVRSSPFRCEKLMLTFHDTTLGGEDADRKSAGAPEVCNEYQVFNVSRRTYLSQSFGSRSHELILWESPSQFVTLLMQGPHDNDGTEYDVITRHVMNKISRIECSNAVEVKPVSRSRGPYPEPAPCFVVSIFELLLFDPKNFASFILQEATALSTGNTFISHSLSDW